ncbi:MAG: hypothetical protein AMXMBFR23_09710 [Chloroflexota bacterium]
MLRIVFWILIALVLIAVAIAGAFTGFAAETLGALTLVVAFATLYRVVPPASRVLVMRQDELGLSDLIFYLYDEAEGRVPRDYLLQLHVAVANVGGRKAIVSHVEIDGFLDESGARIDLPDATTRIRANEYRFESGWRDGHYYYDSRQVNGPRLLEPGDVVTLRFRTRRGIDWSEHWNPASLSEFHAALAKRFAAATGSVTWREGEKVKKSRFKLDLTVEQQAEYVDAIRTLTDDFTKMPETGFQPIQLE